MASKMLLAHQYPVCDLFLKDKNGIRLPKYKKDYAIEFISKSERKKVVKGKYYAYLHDALKQCPYIYGIEAFGNQVMHTFRTQYTCIGTITTNNDCAVAVEGLEYYLRPDAQLSGGEKAYVLNQVYVANEKMARPGPATDDYGNILSISETYENLNPCDYETLVEFEDSWKNGVIDKNNGTKWFPWKLEDFRVTLSSKKINNTGSDEDEEFREYCSQKEVTWRSVTLQAFFNQYCEVESDEDFCKYLCDDYNGDKNKVKSLLEKIEVARQSQYTWSQGSMDHVASKLFFGVDALDVRDFMNMYLHNVASMEDRESIVGGIQEHFRTDKNKIYRDLVGKSSTGGSRKKNKSKKAPEVTDYLAVKFNEEVLKRACTALFDYVKAFGSCFHVGENVLPTLLLEPGKDDFNKTIYFPRLVSKFVSEEVCSDIVTYFVNVLDTKADENDAKKQHYHIASMLVKNVEHLEMSVKENKWIRDDDHVWFKSRHQQERNYFYLPKRVLNCLKRDFHLYYHEYKVIPTSNVKLVGGDHQQTFFAFRFGNVELDDQQFTIEIVTSDNIQKEAFGSSSSSSTSSPLRNGGTNKNDDELYETEEEEKQESEEEEVQHEAPRTTYFFTGKPVEMQRTKRGKKNRGDICYSTGTHIGEKVDDLTLNARAIRTTPCVGVNEFTNKTVVSKHYCYLKFGKNVICVLKSKFDHYFSSKPLPEEPPANGSSSGSFSTPNNNLKKRKKQPSPNKCVKIAEEPPANHVKSKEKAEKMGYTNDDAALNKCYENAVKSNRSAQEPHVEKVVASSPYVELKPKEVTLAFNNVTNGVYVKHQGTQQGITWHQVTHVTTATTSMDVTKLKKEIMQALVDSKDTMKKMYAVDTGMSGETPPTTVIVREFDETELTLDCFDDASGTYTTEDNMLNKGELQQFAGLTKNKVRCLKTMVYTGDRWEEQDSIQDGIAAFNAQESGKQVMVFFLEAVESTPPRTPVFSSKPQGEIISSAKHTPVKSSSQPQGKVISSAKHTPVASSSSSSSSSSSKPGEVIADADNVTKVRELCVLDGNLVTYLGRMDDKKVYTLPHKNIELDIVGGKHMVKGDLPPTSAPRGKKRKKRSVVTDPFPGWRRVLTKKIAGLYCDISRNNIWKGNTCMTDAKFLIVQGVGGVLVKSDEYDRLQGLQVKKQKR